MGAMMSPYRNKRDDSSQRAKPSKERLNQSLRVAMWDVYEHRCAYTDELCEVIDRLAECYLRVAEDLERYVLRSIRFPYAQRGYQLYRTPPWLWSAVLAFAEAHETEKGDSEWHVFSTNGKGFAIFPLDGGRPVAPQYHNRAQFAPTTGNHSPYQQINVTHLIIALLAWHARHPICVYNTNL